MSEFEKLQTENVTLKSKVETISGYQNIIAAKTEIIAALCEDKERFKADLAALREDGRNV